MPLTVKVNGQMFGLVHKASNHLSNSTAPDVCKTPSPAGPVPIPYPVIISQSSDLSNGTTTVTADSGQMIAVKDCEYARCTGDEAGTAGGVVSSTFIKEAKFILFSMDVKMDGKNACRLGDKMTMNHQNTVCMAGTLPTPVPAVPPSETLEKIACECDKMTPKDGESCRALGTRKHACCDKALKEKKGFQGEQGYDKTGAKSAVSRIKQVTESFGQFFARIKGISFPDAASLDGDGNVTQFFDFKFQCPKPPRKSDTPRPQVWGKGQFEKYSALGKKLKPKAKKDPAIVSNEKCK